jgi:hypothetical protein
MPAIRRLSCLHCFAFVGGAFGHDERNVIVLLGGAEALDLFDD